MGAGLLLVVLVVVLAAAAGVLFALRSQAAATLGGGAGGKTTLSRGIDPFTVGEPWRQFVQDALKARSRFWEGLDRTRPGPLRERLQDIGSQLDRGVDEVWATAQRGHDLGRARRRIDTTAVERRLADQRSAQERARAEDPLSLDDTAARTVRSLQGQLEAAHRLDEVTAQAEATLSLLRAQLDEAVARAAEVAASSAIDAGALAGVGDEIDQVVVEVEALRLALEEAGDIGPAGPTGMTGTA